MSISGLLKATEIAAQQFLGYNPQQVIVLHHNDADGLSSGAILVKMLERAAIKTRRYCLEKPYPEALKLIFEDAADQPEVVFLMADFASGMMPTIVELNQKKHAVFVIDHHLIKPVNDARITLLNCLDFGFIGSKHCSASALCFLFAQAVNPLNQDLSALAIVGACGDRQFDSSGKFSEVNASVYQRAEKLGLARYRTCYEVLSDHWQPAEKIANDLDALGGFGYLQGGPDIGLKGLCDGFSSLFSEHAKVFQDQFSVLCQQSFENEKLNQSKHIQWFTLNQKFSSSGVKTVGLVAEWLSKQTFVNPEKYIAGFQKIDPQVPGLGNVLNAGFKVSMRLGSELRKLVEGGHYPELTKILPQATEAVGGFVDACHPHAAATTIPLGRELDLIEKMEQLITAQKVAI